MPRRLRFSLATILLITTCCALALGVLASTAWRQWELSDLERENRELRALLGVSPRRGPPEAVIRDWPMTVSMNEWGRFANGRPWNLSVNSAGEAELTIHTRPKDTVVTVIVTDQQLAELRDLLIQERFFGLAAGYGEFVPDGSTQTITIAVGEFTQTVRLNFLMNWANSNPDKLRDPARAVRVGMLIRGWFQHPDAVDLRTYNQGVLDAVERYNRAQDQKPGESPPSPRTVQ